MAAALLVGSAALRAAEPAETAGWQALAGYQFGDAHRAFLRAPAGSRAAVLGEAASRINQPPVTAGRVAEAEEKLRGLLAADGTDEVALAARYLLARIAHLHRPAEIAEIEAGYRAVLAANAAHPLAQVAAGKLALVLLYQRPDLSVAQRLTGAAALEPVAGRADLPEAASAYYRAMAGAALFYEALDARVLEWLKRADALQPRDLLVASGVRIQLAEVARALGRREEAIAFYRSFLGSILPTDNRRLTALERMQELEKGGGK